MRELSYVIALIAGLVAIAAAAAWLKIVRNPKNDLTAGGGGKPTTRRLRRASALVAIALGLSGVAAVVAVVGSVLRLFKI
jgi:hypothetical protein